MRMPFGKHEGEDLDDLPTSYIEWLLENVEDLSPSLQEELENQLIGRRGGGIVRRRGDA